MASPSTHRHNTTLIHRPEPRVAVKKPVESVFLFENRQQKSTQDMRHGRHLRSSSMHYSSDGPSLRKTSHTRPKSIDVSARALHIPGATVSGGGSVAALKAAQLSASAHHLQEHRTLVTATPRTQKVSPYLAAASKAWSNSAAKEKMNENRVAARLEVPAFVSSGLEPTTRKSIESSRPLQTEFTLPMRSGGRSKSQTSDMMVQEINNHINAETTHQGPLQAARISFAHDREAHASGASRPPSRPASTHPVSHPLDRVERQNKSAITLPWTERHVSPPPIRISSDNRRDALSAASMTWASHEHDNPRPITPAIEPYNYITHKPHVTLRKVHKEEMGKFWKHGRVQPMSSHDRKRYEGLWAANKGILLENTSFYKEDVANVVVRDIWQRSRLQGEILSAIYDLVDREHKGRLTRDEFVVGTWLVDHSLRGRKLPYKTDLTDDLFDGGYIARLGIKLPRKFRHDEKKYLLEKKPNKPAKKSKK